MLLNFTKKKFPQGFLGNQIPRELLFDPFCRTVSRLDFKPDLFNYDLKSEHLPTLFKQKIESLSWEECSHRRAAELMKLDRKHFIFSWSGGIDSTAMMVAILNVWPEAMKKRLTISLSYSSLQENAEFFEGFLAPLRLRSSMVDISDKLIEEEAVVFTGEMGDQLFGSDILAPAISALGEGILKAKFEDAVPRIIDIYNRSEGSGSVIFNHFHPIVAEAPFPLRTAFDFFWWLNFSQKWQHVKYRFVEQTPWNLNALYGREIVHFYDTPEFQRWSVDNHDLKIGHDWNSYKLEAKRYISKYTKSQKVLSQPKIPSLALRNFILRKRIAVTSNLKEISSDQELAQYVRFST